MGEGAAHQRSQPVADHLAHLVFAKRRQDPCQTITNQTAGSEYRPAHQEQLAFRRIEEEIAQQLLIGGQCTACEVSLYDRFGVVADERGVQRW